MLNYLYFSSDCSFDLFKDIVKETSSRGHYNLPEQDTSYVDNYLNNLNKQQKLYTITDVVVVGIGGSSLGTKAVYQFIKPVKKLKRNLHFIESTDPVSIYSLCASLNLQNTHFLIISKSGSTIETISAYKYLLNLVSNVKHNYKLFTFITDKNSPLEQHAKAVSSLVINIKDNVSGRFSVLSAVGIIPFALAGIDVNNLLQGAKDIKDNFFKAGDINQILLKKAFFYANNLTSYNINAIFSYADSLQYFNQWYVQLWGESLGKKQINSKSSVGLTPVGLIGPKDQHSFLQLLVEGTFDKTVTFIKLAQFENETKIPNTPLIKLDEFNFINNINFSTLINLQADSIIESLKNLQKIPLDEIIIQKQDEFNIGKLIYYYELLTSLVGKLLNVNVYNQPGVELSKKILIQRLKKIKS